MKLHSFLDKIISDRGTQFVAKFWPEFLALVGVEQGLSSGYHPQIDRQSKQVNQMLEGFLHCYLNYQQHNWVDLLQFAEYVYNNSVYVSSAGTPFQIMQGLEVKPVL